MARTPEDSGLQSLLEPGLDPEDAVLEVDDEGFLVSSGHRWHLPTDVEAWAGWAGEAMVAVAAFETVAFLIVAALDGWVPGLDNVTLPRPDGYYALLLLGGVLVLVLRRGGAAGSEPRWGLGAACLAAGTGGALVLAGLVSNIAVLIDPSGSVAGTVADPYAPPEVAGVVVAAVAGCVAALLAAFAAALAVLLYRRLRLARTETGTEAGPRAGRVVPMGPVMASLTIGAAAAVGCMAAFQAGVASHPNNLLETPPAASAAPVTFLAVPTPESTTGQITIGSLPSGCSIEDSGVGLIVACPISHSALTVTATPGPLT
jgi:hypothetical protein